MLRYSIDKLVNELFLFGAFYIYTIYIMYSLGCTYIHVHAYTYTRDILLYTHLHGILCTVMGIKSPFMIGKLFLRKLLLEVIDRRTAGKEIKDNIKKKTIEFAEIFCGNTCDSSRLGLLNSIAFRNSFQKCIR